MSPPEPASHRADARLLRRLFGVLLRHRVATVVAVLAIYAPLAFSATGIVLRNDMAVWFVEGDPALVEYQSFLTQFGAGGSDEVMVATVPGAAAATSPQRLQALADLTTRLAAVDGVARVQSLANVRVATSDSEGALSAHAVVEGPVESDDVARAEAARQGLAGRLVGKDGTTQIVMLWAQNRPDIDVIRGRLVSDVRAALSVHEGAALAGGGVLYDAVNDLTTKDGALFIGLASLVVLLAVAFTTRRLLWVVVGLCAVWAADACMFGLMALTGTPLNAVTVALPTLVMILSVAHVLHIASELDRLPPGTAPDDHDAIAAAFSRVAAPALLNNLTTMGGLLALLSASTAVTRQWGLFAAAGTGFAFLFVFLLSSAAAARVVKKRRVVRAAALDGNAATPRDAVTAALARAAATRAPLVLGTSALVVAACVGLAARIVVDTSTIGFLPADHQVVKDTATVERLAGPFIPLEVKLTFERAGAWREPAALEALSSLNARLATADADHSFGAPVSAIDVAREGARALKPPGASSGDRFTGDELAGALSFLEATGDAAPLLVPLVASGDAVVRVTIPTRMDTAKGFVAAGERARAVVQDATQHLSPPPRVDVTGYLPLYGRIVRAIVDDQIVSFALAALVIFGLIALVLRGARLFVLALVPNLLPIALLGGAMGALGIRLDLATMTIAATILGVIVDDTVHVLHRFQAALRQGASASDALEHAARTAGAANLGANAIVIAGFLVMALASIQTVAAIGLLSAIAVSGALVADLVVLPALAAVLYRTPRAQPVTP